MEKYQKLLEELIYLQERYSLTYRQTIQPQKFLLNKISNLNDVRIRESLLEHVGHLPIIATKIYPFLDDSSVDIGKTLTMLAIHDIGELVTGDTFTYLKSDDDSQEEYEHALKLLDPVYHPFYEDVENQKSNSGKFAKSIDKMAPDLWELSLEPKESITRYQNKLGIKPKEIISLKKKSKMKYMEWNPFLSEFYEFILQNLEKHFFNK